MIFGIESMILGILILVLYVCVSLLASLEQVFDISTC